MELSEETKQVYIETAKVLKGSDSRLFMARVVKTLCEGGQRRAARELGWDRETIRKGMYELERGIICIDAYGARGCKRTEERLPNLLEDIRVIVDSQSQTDPRYERYFL